jgi:hypothetical protein
METRLTFDAGEKVIVAETVQDVEPILERNHALRGEPQKSDWGRHIATIPNVISSSGSTRNTRAATWGCVFTRRSSTRSSQRSSPTRAGSSCAWTSDW